MTRLLIAGLLVALPFSAGAQTLLCGERPDVVAALAAKRGETPVNHGVRGDQLALETYANPKTGTFTIVVTDTDGLTCLVMGGDGFERLKQESVANPM